MVRYPHPFSGMVYLYKHNKRLYLEFKAMVNTDINKTILIVTKLELDLV